VNEYTAENVLVSERLLKLHPVFTYTSYVVLGDSTDPVFAVVVGAITKLLTTGVAYGPAPDATTSYPYPAGVPLAGAVQLRSADVAVTFDDVTPVGGGQFGAAVIVNSSTAILQVPLP
jgi:hypothetical protein